MGSIIGIDLGGTNIKAASVAKKGKIIKEYEIATESEKGTKTVIDNVISAVNKVKSGKIIGIGIGSPGPMDYENGVITNPVNLPFRNVPLKKIIQKKFSLPVFLDNDANCFALGEAIFGAGKKYQNVIGITLGTGVGGGVIIDKKIYHGRGNAAELGHMTIKFDGLKARSGNNGDIEEYVSARGLRKIFKGSDPYSIYELAIKRNKRAIKTFEEMGCYLGIGLANIIYAFDPDIIVVGGKISNSWKFFSKAMYKAVKERYFSKLCHIVKSELKNAGILGAAALLLEDA
ncbi:ROK family protein [Candidatus Woesearchaeota archaeon]|nr:ROK family protein [Candidatus Woesearchaeota archaeon]